MVSKDELTELFRRSGGRFDNAALGYRAEEGFYVYSLNSDKETVVLCPAHLLIDTDDLDICEDGLFITNPEKYGTHIEFLQKYLAFHFNKKMLERYLERKRQIDSLTEHELDLITGICPLDACTIRNTAEQQYAKEQIFKCYRINYRGRHVLMPYVSFLNHDRNGISFKIRNGAVFVNGKFSNEVNALYNRDDALGLMIDYGFVTDTRFAYSIPITISTTAGGKIIIAREQEEYSVSSEGSQLPLIKKNNSTVSVSWFPLYFEFDPQYPVRASQLVAREAGLPPVMILNQVFRSNLAVLVPAAVQLRESDNPYARLVAAAAQKQLELIGGGCIRR